MLKITNYFRKQNILKTFFLGLQIFKTTLQNLRGHVTCLKRPCRICEVMLHVENDLAEFAMPYLKLNSSLRKMGRGFCWGDNG